MCYVPITALFCLVTLADAGQCSGLGMILKRMSRIRKKMEKENKRKHIFTRDLVKTACLMLTHEQEEDRLHGKMVQPTNA
jgi:hypothetical protein